MNKKIAHLLLILSGSFAFSLYLLTTNAFCDQKAIKGKATTLYIAYTCNTWGQLQPCPS